MNGLVAFGDSLRAMFLLAIHSLLGTCLRDCVMRQPCENHFMAELDMISKLFAALVSTQGILQTLLDGKVLPPDLEAKVRAAISVNNPIIEEGSNHKQNP